MTFQAKAPDQQIGAQPVRRDRSRSALRTKPISDLVDEKILALERTRDCFTKILEDSQLVCQLPRKSSTGLAGSVLKHVFSTVQSILDKEWPAVFKVGITHDPHFRFRNRKFGYAHDRHQRWQCMVVLFASSEALGPAYVEAALIQKYKGPSKQLRLCDFN